MNEAKRARPDTSDVLDTFSAECAALSLLLFDLSEEQYALPTRCRPWDVKDLVAHVWRSLFRIPTALDEPPNDAPADTDAVTYWRSYDPADDSQLIAQHAHETAVEHATGRALAESFDELWRDCVARVARENSARVIQTWWGPRIRLDEFVATRVLEVLVHGLDLTTALGRSPAGTPAGTSLVVDILTGLLGGDPPSALQWSDIDFIDKACGRTPLDDREAAILRAAAGKFPLLG